MVLTPTAGRGDPLSSPARPRRPVNGPSHRLLAAFRSSTPPPVAQSAQPAESAIYARIHAAANTADLVMPDSLKFDADRRFFEQGLDGVDVVVHGRHSLEEQTHSASRRRIVLTRGIPSIERHSSNERALWWNPAGASFDEALTALGIPEANVGVIGGPDVFVLFLERYNAFYLSRAPHVLLPGGRPVFPGVPARRPEEILASHGLVPFAAHVLDAAKGVTMVPWRRAR